MPRLQVPPQVAPWRALLAEGVPPVPPQVVEAWGVPWGALLLALLW